MEGELLCFLSERTERSRTSTAQSTVYLVEEAFGADSNIVKFFPIFRTSMEKKAPLVIPGLGEPGVKRGVPKGVRAPRNDMF